jgi:hypothetical protein
LLISNGGFVMIRRLLCLLGLHEWELKEVTVFLDTDNMNVCRYCGRYQYPILLKALKRVK